MPAVTRALVEELTRKTIRHMHRFELPAVSHRLIKQAQVISEIVGRAVDKEPPQHDLEAMWKEVALVWAERRSLTGVSSRSMRSMPYLLYYTPREGSRFVDMPDLVKNYLVYLQQQPAARKVRTLIKLFLQEYPSESRSFEILRHGLKGMLERSQSAALEEWRHRADWFGLFELAPVRLAAALSEAADPDAASSVVRDAGMDDEWNNWGILRAARLMLWNWAEERIKTSSHEALPAEVETLLRSSVRDRRLRIISEKERIAAALIRPFHGLTPDSWTLIA